MPFLLGDELLADLLSIARTHIDRLERAALEPKVQWRSTSSTITRKGRSKPEEIVRGTTRLKQSLSEGLASPGCATPGPGAGRTPEIPGKQSPR